MTQLLMLWIMAVNALLIWHFWTHLQSSSSRDTLSEDIRRLREKAEALGQAGPRQVPPPVPTPPHRGAAS